MLLSSLRGRWAKAVAVAVAVLDAKVCDDTLLVKLADRSNNQVLQLQFILRANDENESS